MDPIELLIAAAIALLGTFMGLAVVGLMRRARATGTLPSRVGVGSILRAIGGALLLAPLFVVLIVYLGPVGVLWCAILVFVLVESVRTHRTSQQNALLWLLTTSAERDMPLGPAVEALARERAGAFSRRAGRLAKLLDLGVPLPDALDFCPGLLSADALPIVRIGSQSGALAPALRLAATAKNWHDVVWASLMAKVSYVLMLPVFGVVVLTFVMIWIIPKFAKIFHDFNAVLPQMTRWLITATFYYFQYWYVLLPLYIAIAVLLLMAVMRYLGWSEADLPGVGRIVRRLDAARILESLAIVAGQQKPMAEGVATLAGTYPKPKIRNSLSLALHDMASGGDWAESLCRHELIRRSDVALLQAAQRVGNLPWAMREIADSNRRRFIYRLQAIVQVAFPPMVILLGLLVMFIVVALFLPLVALIQRLA